MKYSLTIAVIFLAFGCPTMCWAYDHATIVGEYYNFQFCDSCDRSLYRHEEGMYHVPHLNVGNGEAGVMLFNIPDELSPFKHAQLQLFLSSFYAYSPAAFDWSVYGFDGVIGNVGPSDMAQSVRITSPYTVPAFDYYWSVDVTDFLQSAKHSDISFTITGNSAVWIMAYPQLLVFPVPEPDSLTTFATTLGAVFCIRRRRRAPKG